MKRVWFLRVLAAVLVACGTPTWAATVVLNGAGNTNAIAIHELEIQGLFYDVDFEVVDGSTIPITSFDPGDLFAGDATGADAAVSAIRDALNSAGAATVGTERITFVVPYQFGQGCLDFCAYRGRNTTGVWLNNGDADIDQEANITFARFNPVVVQTPVPPALYLFGTGLGVLVTQARRRKKGLRGGANSITARRAASA